MQLSAPLPKVIFQPAGRQGEFPQGINLLEAARRLGVEIESICGGHQTCAKCLILVEEGNFPKFAVRSQADHLTPPSEQEQALAGRRGFAPNARLSCACQVSGDLVIHVPESSQARKQVVRKTAGIKRAMTVDPAMRLYYANLPAAKMKDHRGDWERLRDTLQSIFGLKHLHIDPAILSTLQPALATGKRAVTVTVDQNGQIVRVQPGFHDRIWGVAVDVGTTTVAMHLCDLRRGDVQAIASSMNPQVPFGEDLMSRVSYAKENPHGTQRMHEAIVNGLNELLVNVCAQVHICPDDVVDMVIVGNTTMQHLLLGVNPQELGSAPFSLVTHNALHVKARDLGIHISRGGNVYIPPCEAGHVGSDNVGVLIAEAPFAQDEQMLVIDIGTNGEILLGNRERMLSASSPTGPAFEGAQIRHGMRATPGAIERVRIDPATLTVRYKVIGSEEWRTPEESNCRNSPLQLASGICGSGIIEAIAELYMAGLLAGNGRFVEFDHPRLRAHGGKAEFILAFPDETSTGHEISVHADDIRAIQLGKAALYAGTKLLMKRLGLERVDRIVLTGGFGSYIDPQHAMILGLLPDCDLAKVQPVGNAAGDGARMMLLDKSKRAEAQWAARWLRYIEIAVEPTFQQEFVAAITIPHAVDPFPHLADYLDNCRSRWSSDREQAIAALENRGSGRRTSQKERAARRAARQRRKKQDSLLA